MLLVRINGHAIPSTDATLSALALADGDGTAVALNETFDKNTTSYTASVAQGIDEITITPTATHSNATLKYFDADDMRIFNADQTVDGDQVSLAKGANTINVEVTAEDEVTTGTYTVVVTWMVEIWVPLSWSLVPAGLDTGDTFRMLFLSSTKRLGSSTNIAVYNTFIQERAAAGHADI